MTHKSLFIRCSEDTYKLAHALAKKENRSLNKQMIHMIHALADEKNVSVDELQKDVWGYVSELETHTVETHIYRLRKKMKDYFDDENFIKSTKNGYLIN